MEIQISFLGPISLRKQMITPTSDIAQAIESHDESVKQELSDIPKERLKLGLSQICSTPDGQHYAFSELNLMVGNIELLKYNNAECRIKKCRGIVEFQVYPNS